MIPVKPSTRLPSRAAMKTLFKSKMTTQDYAKATPLNATESMAPLLQQLRKKEK